MKLSLIAFGVYYGFSLELPCCLAAAPGSIDPSFDPGSAIGKRYINEVAVNAILLHDDKILVGGDFYWGNSPQVSIGVARLNQDGSMDPSFLIHPGPDSAVKALARDAIGRVLIGGQFWNFNGHRHQGLVRVSAAGDLEADYVPLGTSSEVWGLSAGEHDLIVFGECLLSPCLKPIVTLRVDDNGIADRSFTPELSLTDNSWVAAFGFQKDRRIIVAGAYNGGGSGFLARLNADGSVDPTFRQLVGLTGWVQSVKVLKDDRIFVAFSRPQLLPPMIETSFVGLFDPDGNVQTNLTRIDFASAVGELQDGSLLVAGAVFRGGPKGFSVLRLLPSGAVDTNFICQVSQVNTIVTQPDGKVLIGGTFSVVNGVPRIGIARLFGIEEIPQPILLNPSKSLGRFGFQVNTVTNRTYHLETTSELSSSRWTGIETTPGDGGNQTISDEEATPSHRFYRLRVE